MVQSTDIKKRYIFASVKELIIDYLNRWHNHKYYNRCKFLIYNLAMEKYLNIREC